LTAPPAWLVEVEAPQGEEWLTDSERARAASLATSTRRRDWVLGRAAAKRLLAASESARSGEPLGLADVEVLADGTGAPVAALSPARGGGRLPWSLSLSHSGGAAVAALLPEGEGIPGIDLELVEPRAPSFVETFFTPAEARQAARAGAGRDLFVTATWSAKEAVLKALHLGLTVDTRDVEALPTALTAGPGGPWRIVDVRAGRAGGSLPIAHGESLVASWRTLGPWVLALAVRGRAGPAPGSPSRGAAPSALPHVGGVPEASLLSQRPDRSTR
jgi:4'-phosphopantetheinyl transferase